MGDRANVRVKSQASDVFLYTHWGGYALPETVRKALSLRERWSDDSYLARIIFCSMVRGDDAEATTGFGISSTIGDGEDQLITVDVEAQTVKVNAQAPVSFKDYISSPAPSWDG